MERQSPHKHKHSGCSKHNAGIAAAPNASIASIASLKRSRSVADFALLVSATGDAYAAEDSQVEQMSKRLMEFRLGARCNAEM